MANDEDAAGVMIQYLPTFSTERFYLLSELEELCGTLLSIYDETSVECDNPENYWKEKYKNKSSKDNLDNEQKKYEQQEGKDEKIYLIYILWKEKDGVETLLKVFEETLGSFEFNKNNNIPRIIAVEILLNEKGSWIKEQEKFYIHTLQQLAHQYPCLQLIFGIADNFASPALESLLNAAIEFQKQSKLCSVISSRSDNYLGHNLNAEPDALSGVFQVLLILNTTTELNNLAIPAHNPLDIVQPKSKFDLIRSQGVLFLLVAALSWFVYAYTSIKKE